MNEPWNIFADSERNLSIIASSLYFYVLVVALVRLMGKRTTAQMNNFDWIINVAVGSLVASGILFKNVPVMGATAAILTIAICQWLLPWLSIRTKAVEQVVKAAPALLVHEGAYLRGAMRSERISQSELDAAIRQKGYGSLSEIYCAILESDGKISIISAEQQQKSGAELVEDVRRKDRH